MKRPILSLILFLAPFSTLLSQKWDRQMQLIQCNIKVKADIFTATTFIEMEFYNANNSDIEGLYQFTLLPTQVVTAFQLELNGKYRDGSIEERGKATGAYNSIVGKRIDPALLTMDGAGNYSLRIFPVPANGSRKVTMTIQQPMQVVNEFANYRLPLDVKKHILNFSLHIDVNSNETPVAKDGLIKGYDFSGKQWNYNYNTARDIWLDRALEFSIPLALQQPLICNKVVDDKNYFAVRFLPAVSKEYSIDPKSISVFWDISSSNKSRNIEKEIRFLEQYIEQHKTGKVNIITFNFHPVDTVRFDNAAKDQRSWKKFLDALQYDGGTQLGCIDLSSVRSEVTFIFSDGWSTYGKDLPKKGDGLVYSVSSGTAVNQMLLTSIVKNTGGEHIDLEKVNVANAVQQAGKANNILLRIRSNGKTVLNESPGQDVDKPILLSGYTSNTTDTLVIYYGNSKTVWGTQKIIVGGNSNCNGNAIERMGMFIRFVEMHRYPSDWNALIDFGLQEKVVTQNTAYIVLERIEDYKTYNIAPPKDLQAECDGINYVWQDTRVQRQNNMQQLKLRELNNVTAYYNERIRWWDATVPTMQVTDGNLAEYKSKALYNSNASVSMGNTYDVNTNLLGSVANGASDISEVVVTVPYGIQRKEFGYMAYSASYMTNGIFAGNATSVINTLSGRVAGVMVTGSGMESKILLRGMSSINAYRGPLLVIDGVPTDRSVNDININDIENISVLKDAAASAIYGSRGANGVILITTKHGRNVSYSYDNRSKLSNQEDIDYIQEIKAAQGNKYYAYLELRDATKRDAGFYFDMACYLFEKGYKKEALTVLSNAAEESNGYPATQRAIAFVLDSWKYFDESILIYQHLLSTSSNNYDYISDLAWALYQKGNVQEAVDLLFSKVMEDNDQNYYYYGMSKAALLEQMNAMINIHRSELDLTAIPANMIRPMPVDLKVFIEGNMNYASQVEVREPGGTKASEYVSSRSKGKIMNSPLYYGSGREYAVKDAKEGNYTITTYHFDYAQKNNPSFIRLFVVKNYGRKEQEISIENICMDNQRGWVEIGEVKVKK